jgi:hypothetical protein
MIIFYKKYSFLNKQNAGDRKEILGSIFFIKKTRIFLKHLHFLKLKILFYFIFLQPVFSVGYENF